MRNVFFAATLAISFAACPVFAQTAAPATAPKAAPAATHYTTSDTDIGTLLDDPAARAIVDKYIPGFSTGEQVDMARSLTLKSVQQYAPDRMSDQALADIDAAFAKLPAKK